MAKKVSPFNMILVIDSETSGIAFGSDDPSYDPKTGNTYQAVSWGLIVARADNFTPIEELYVEVKWDGVSDWQPAAERVHGLSKEYLAKHGKTSEEAVQLIANLILDYWGPDGVVCLMGYNVATFDIFFLRRLLREHGIEIKFGYRSADLFSAGFTTFGTQTSDELFEIVGLPPRDDHNHNALTDAQNTLKSAEVIRTIFKSAVGDA